MHGAVVIRKGSSDHHGEKGDQAEGTGSDSPSGRSMRTSPSWQVIGAAKRSPGSATLLIRPFLTSSKEWKWRGAFRSGRTRDVWRGLQGGREVTFILGCRAGGDPSGLFNSSLDGNTGAPSVTSCKGDKD